MRLGLKPVLITLPLIALGAGVLIATIKTKAPPPQIEAVEHAVPVRVVTVQDGVLTPIVTGHGLVAPARTFEAIGQVAGTVAEVHPDLARGKVIPAGTLMLRIANEDYRLALAQAEANIRAAEAKLAELSISQENQQAARDIDAQVLALKAADLARIEALHGTGNIAQTGLDAARSAHLSQRQRLQSIDSALALLPAQRQAQIEQIAVSRAGAETARLNLSRTEMRLPFDARVAEVHVEQGRFLRVGEIAAVLDGIEAAEVEAQVPVAELRRLLRLAAPRASGFAADPTAMTDVLRALSLEAEVRLDLGDEILTWPARVDRVSDTIDPRTATLGVIVTIETAYTGAAPDQKPPLTKGMFVEVVISGKPVAGRLVPRVAVRDGRVKLVGQDERLDSRTVVPALVQGEIAVITEGLTAGERVVVSDPPVAFDGMLLAPDDVAFSETASEGGR